MSRVVHVINTVEVGGGAEHLVHLARGLLRHDWESVVLAGCDGPARARLAETQATVEIVGALGMGAPVTLAACLRRHKPDLVHLHGSRSGLLGALAARLAPARPVVYTAHMFSFRRRLPQPLPWLAGRAEILAASLVDRVICVSSSDREAAEAVGLDRARIVVVPNGIDLARFPARADRRAEFGFVADTPVVGTVGRLVDQKDPLAFARMALRLAERRPDARFLVVGDGPLRGALESAAAPLVRDRRLVVTGFRDDVPELLATLDVAVFPSRWEAQGLALIEAMAAGRAVIASRLPAHAEAVEEGESGLLVPVGDDEEMADRAVALLADPARRARLGACARQRAERRYRIEAMVDATAEVYRAVRAAGRAVVHAA